MATLAELYEFLETKQDDSHLDSRFSYDAFSIRRKFLRNDAVDTN